MTDESQPYHGQPPIPPPPPGPSPYGQPAPHPGQQPTYGQPAPEYGQPGPQYGQAGPQYGQPGPQYGQAPAPWQQGATWPGDPTQQPTPPKRRRTGKIAVVAATLLAVLGGGAFAVTSLTGDDAGGAESPEAAVEAMFAAMGNADILGMLDAMAPSERNSFKDPLIDVTAELVRLEVLDEGVDLSAMSGFEVLFENLELSSEELSPGFSTVSIDGGDASGTFDPAELPLGPFVDGLIDTNELDPVDGESDLAEELSQDGPDPVLVAVEEDGGWFVSFWFTVAENARRALDADLPDFEDPIGGAGAETPEDAVRDVIDAATQLDIRRLVELTPPDEMRALHVYGTLFIDDAQEQLDDMISESGFSYQVDITDFEATADVSGDIARVTVDRLGLTASLTDGFTSTDIVVDPDTGCVEVTVSDDFSDDTQEFCTGDVQDQLDAIGVELPTFLTDLQGEIELAIVVTRVDGGWYVSPLRTYAEVVIDVLRALDPQDLEEFVEFVEGMRGN